jgi:cell division septum initiation protein DivIVA
MSGGDHQATTVDESLLGIVDFPAVRRGYAPANVQAFVSAAHAEMRRLAGENRRLQLRVDELEDILADLSDRQNATVVAPAVAPVAVAAPAPLAPPASPLDEWGQRTAELLAGARSDIDKMLAAARDRADQIVAQAHVDAAGIKENAEHEAALRLARSDDQRSRLVAEAMDEQQRAAIATDHARAELAKVERQRESISASLRSLQSALQQAVETIGKQTPPPVELADHRDAAVDTDDVDDVDDDLEDTTGSSGSSGSSVVSFDRLTRSGRDAS